LIERACIIFDDARDDVVFVAAYSMASLKGST